MLHVLLMVETIFIVVKMRADAVGFNILGPFAAIAFGTIRQNTASALAQS